MEKMNKKNREREGTEIKLKLAYEQILFSLEWQYVIKSIRKKK